MLCDTKLVKNGKTGAGTQRWKCPACGVSSIRNRADVTRRNQLTAFLRWLTGKHSQAEIDGLTGRSFRYATAWCWNIQPRLGPVTTTHHQILVDGIWVGSWCLLIAVTEKLEVLAWQWCGSESAAAWTALLQQLPAPDVIVCDGGTGLSSAVGNTWPETKTQRCLFHVQMNIRRHLTMNPRTNAGRRLRALSLELSHVHDTDHVIAWRLKLEVWWQAYGHLTRERSYDGRKWWYTHDRLRKAWQLLSRLTRNGTLFTYIKNGNSRTTSPLEGGINNGIRTVLRNHRGMSEAHMKRAAEWFLTLHETPIDQAHKLIDSPNPKPTQDAPNTPHNTANPALYDTGLNPEEGLWHRKGWAGRT